MLYSQDFLHQQQKVVLVQKEQDQIAHEARKTAMLYLQEFLHQSQKVMIAQREWNQSAQRATELILIIIC